MLRLSFLSYMIIIYTILCMLGIQLRFIMIVFRGTKTLRCNIHLKNWPRSQTHAASFKQELVKKLVMTV